MAAPRVLVADDQADILEALRLLLSDAGFATDLVDSVDGVVDRVSQRQYDLLLMDLNYARDTTSGREGLELLDRVRVQDHALPVIVMTGWGSIDTAVEAMRRGAKRFVQKPWDDSTLVEAVRREIDEGLASRRLDARQTREHEEARLIQRALLPASIPRVEDCDIAALWTPASGIGGDWYDVLRFSSTRVGLSIADVIGKGLPAALLMSNLQAAARAFATSDADPNEVCSRVNRLLCRNIEPGKFVTFCYILLDTRARQLTYSNAGHSPPLLFHVDGRVDRLKTSGIVLGVAPDHAYATGTLTLEPGDRLICFTDGISEATSADDEEFGDDRLIETVAAHATESAKALAQRVMDTVTRWSGGTLQDDATLIVAAID